LMACTTDERGRRRRSSCRWEPRDVCGYYSIQSNKHKVISY
jgi:hypothetical protein